MSTKTRSKKSRAIEPSRNISANSEGTGGNLYVDNVGELLILESINSPFIVGSEQPLKMYDVAVAFYVLTRKNNSEIRDQIAKGEFFQAVDKWIEKLPPSQMAGKGEAIQKALQKAFTQKAAQV